MTFQREFFFILLSSPSAFSSSFSFALLLFFWFFSSLILLAADHIERDRGRLGETVRAATALGLGQRRSRGDGWEMNSSGAQDFWAAAMEFAAG